MVNITTQKTQTHHFNTKIPVNFYPGYELQTGRWWVYRNEVKWKGCQEV